MGRTRIHLCAVFVCLATIAGTQELTPPLGDVARQERERRAATRAAAGPQQGSPPPAALLGELVPAHFLRFEGEVAEGEYSVSVNGKTLLRNARVRGLPLYVSPYLLEGGNQLEVEFTSHAGSPLDVIVEERFAGESGHRELVRFHADANQFPEMTHQQVVFTAHPKVIPSVQLTDADRVAIHKLVQAFYDATASKDSLGVMKLFEPAIQDAREIYSEGADFGQNEMARLAHIVALPECTMEPYSPAGLAFSISGNVVTVKRANGAPVFSSNEVQVEPGQVDKSRVSADVIPVKKINDEWKLTLPFGF